MVSGQSRAVKERYALERKDWKLTIPFHIQ
jgi:hypothetical protein